jgi:hypothetical protein
MRLLQLSFLLLLRDQLLAGPGQLVSVFDPAYDAFDQQLVQQLGLSLLPHDTGCALAVQQPTLVYMPCCERQLYHNLLVGGVLRGRRGGC